MNGQENTPTSTFLCANGCGFYGSPTTKNLCSKCYREFLRGEAQQQEQQMKHRQAEAVIRAAVASKSSDPANIESSSGQQEDVLMPSSHLTEAEQFVGQVDHSSTEAEQQETGKQQPSHSGSESSEVSASAADSERPIQKNTRRCYLCNKKVGLLGFQCRCGYSFCGTHRHADSHNCSFDYRELARQQLMKANQRVVADKLNRI